MKKILIILSLLLACPPMASAQTLNFRENSLMSFSYKIEEEEEIFKMYTSNTTNKLLFTTHPKAKPSYQTDYFIKQNAFKNIDTNTQNKIKIWIQATQNCKEFATQLYYYINTQLLIWKTFHPELNIKIEKQYGSVEDYLKELEGKSQKPAWIQNQTIKDSLKIPYQENYILRSQNCEINEDSDGWIVKNCQKNAKVEAIENIEDEIIVYAKETEAILIEAGASPCSWTFQINTIKEEEESPKENSPTLNEKELEDNRKEKDNNNLYHGTKTIKITEVPNTYEKKTKHSMILLMVLLIIKIWQKK